MADHEKFNTTLRVEGQNGTLLVQNPLAPFAGKRQLVQKRPGVRIDRVISVERAVSHIRHYFRHGQKPRIVRNTARRILAVAKLVSGKKLAVEVLFRRADAPFVSQGEARGFPNAEPAAVNKAPIRERIRVKLLEYGDVAGSFVDGLVAEAAPPGSKKFHDLIFSQFCETGKRPSVRRCCGIAFFRVHDRPRLPAGKDGKRFPFPHSVWGEENIPPILVHHAGTRHAGFPGCIPVQRFHLSCNALTVAVLRVRYASSPSYFSKTGSSGSSRSWKRIFR